MASQTTRDKKKRRILFVEDKESFIINCTEFFENDKTLDFVYARNYLEAKSCLQNYSFDIAIVDLGLSEDRLEGSDKLEGIQLVQELAALISPPIVIVSTAYPERARNNPEFPEDFVLDIYDKSDEPLSKLGEDVEKARTIKRIQELLAFTSKYTSGSVPITDTLKTVLRQIAELTSADVCHLLLPTEDESYLEIAVDTGKDEGRTVEIKNSITGYVYTSGKILSITDIGNHPLRRLYQAVVGKGKMNSEMAVPLKEMPDSLDVIGVLNIESESINAFDKKHEELMRLFAEFVVATLQNERRREVLYELVGGTTGHLLEAVVDLEDVLKTVLERGLGLINAKNGFVARVEGNKLHVISATQGSRLRNGDTLDVKKSISGLAVKKHYSINVPDVRKPPYNQYYQEAFGKDIRSELVIPIILENKVEGVLNFESNNLSAFSSEDMRLLVALANQTAIAMRIARQIDQHEDDVRKTERSNTVSDLAAGVTHNVNSPANGILFDLSQIKLNCQKSLQEDPKLITFLNRIEKSANKVLEVPKLVAEKTEQYKPAIPMTCAQLVSPKIDDMLKKELIPNQVNIYVDKTLDTVKMFNAFEYYTPLVIENLVINAIEAMNKAGRIAVSSRLTKEGNSIEILVDDDGPGVRKELREIIFDRSYSKKEEGGIGLWWVKTHLERLGALVFVEDAEIGGARFVLRFPIIGYIK